jgi:hypothetical protein
MNQTTSMQGLVSIPTNHLRVYTTAGHLSLSKFNQFIFFIRYILITPIYALVFQTILSFRYPTKLYVRSLHLCAVQSHNKGILQHTVTWLGHLLVRIGTQTGESFLDDSLMYWQATLASRQQAMLWWHRPSSHITCNVTWWLVRTYYTQNDVCTLRSLLAGKHAHTTILKYSALFCRGHPIVSKLKNYIYIYIFQANTTVSSVWIRKTN